MKLYLSISQAKIVRDALYTKMDAVRGALKGNPKEGEVLDLIEESLQEMGMLISFLNEKISKED